MRRSAAASPQASPRHHVRLRVTAPDAITTVSSNVHPRSHALLDLPDGAAATVAEFLDTHDLCAVVSCCREVSPPLVEAFQRSTRLRIPPDADRNAVVLERIQKPTDDQRPCTRPTQFAIADTDEAAQLLCVANRVRGMLLSSNEYTAWPERPFDWHVLAQFTALTRLEIDHAWDRRIDLTALALACPRLEQLTIKPAQGITNRLVALPALSVLHLEHTNILSFTVALGLPALRSLTLMLSPYRSQRLRDVASLKHVAPLTRLVVRGFWNDCPPAALDVHRETLREYSEYHTRLSPLRLESHVSPLRQWTHLRSLRLGRILQTDTAPLAALASLEKLQLRISPSVRHCRPLRRLTRLRELHITNGFVCDLVGFLPCLEKLVWADDLVANLRPLSTLYRRFADDEDQVLTKNVGSKDDQDAGASSKLRTLVLRGNLYITMECASTRAMLQNVEHVEIQDHHHVERLLPVIATLPHIKRLAFQSVSLPHVRKRLVSFACWQALEELFYCPLYYRICDWEGTIPLPQWFHDRLPSLRVLASPFQESLDMLEPLCPRLTHLHVPFSRNCNFEAAPRDSLIRLCVVYLALSHDCSWLRRERGPGRALPCLRQIFHPTTDCLSSPQCRRHELAVSEDARGFARGFIKNRVLNPTWVHRWEAAEPLGEDELYHRVI